MLVQRPVCLEVWIFFPVICSFLPWKLSFRFARSPCHWVFFYKFFHLGGEKTYMSVFHYPSYPFVYDLEGVLTVCQVQEVFVVLVCHKVFLERYLLWTVEINPSSSRVSHFSDSRLQKPRPLSVTRHINHLQLYRFRRSGRLLESQIPFPVSTSSRVHLGQWCSYLCLNSVLVSSEFF